MSDALARPVFKLRERYSWVECTEPDYGGLWAEIRTNLTHDERAAFTERAAELQSEAEVILQRLIERSVAAAKRQRDATLAVAAATTDEARALAESDVKAANDEAAAANRDLMTASTPEIVANRAARWTLVAPYIRAWNICDEDEQPVPPPKESMLGALPHVDIVIANWLIRSIETGYLGGKGVRSSSNASAASPAPTNGQPSESGPVLRS